MRWLRERVLFVSWGKQWKGIYIHCLSRHWTYRIYYSRALGGLGADRHPKSVEALGHSGIVLHGELRKTVGK